MGDGAFGMSGTDIVDAITNQDAFREVDGKLVTCGQKHAGFWFATRALAAVITLPAWMIGGIIDALHRCLAIGKHGNQCLVDFKKLVFGEIATRDTGLVGDDNHQDARIIEAFDRLCRAVDQFKIGNI